MAQIDGIVKERYTNEEISETLAELEAAGLADLGDRENVERLVKEFYFRGLVHGHAEESKVETVREEIGY